MTDLAKDQGGLDQPAEDRESTPRRRRPWRVLALALIGAVVAGIAMGFIRFAHNVADARPPADPRAEGIVVLTGGTARIDGALQLLEEGRAKRLLISGVNPMVTRETLAATLGGVHRNVIDCCVDLDHARDTIENATETRRWATDHGFASLIVVTSDYHMPRTMAELAEAMPKADLIPFPVSNPELHLENWWRDPEAFGLLATEYGKFLAVEARRMLPDAAAARASAD